MTGCVVICPIGHENLETQKFCGECGAPLVAMRVVESQTTTTGHPSGNETKSIKQEGESEAARKRALAKEAEAEAAEAEALAAAAHARTEAIRAARSGSNVHEGGSGSLGPSDPRPKGELDWWQRLPGSAQAGIVLAVILAVVGTIIGVVIAVNGGGSHSSSAMLTAAPAKADIRCPNGFVPPSVSADCYFLYMMASDKIQANSQAGLITAAHAACADMAADTGRDPVMDEIPIMQRASPALTTQKAALFAGIAAAAYCPQVIRR
jgi:hypothetical protein